jgi:hypothetical protein
MGVDNLLPYFTGLLLFSPFHLYDLKFVVTLVFFPFKREMSSEQV